MSIVAIYITEGADLTEAVKALRPVTKESISDIKTAIASGSPVYRRELWMNDFAEVADDFRGIIAALDRANITFRVTEEVQRVEDEITTEVLTNLLMDSEDYREGSMTNRSTRSAADVGKRVLGLLAVIGLVHEKQQATDWIHLNEIDQYMSDQELQFMNAIDPSERDLVQFSWRAEAMAPLIWAINGIDTMPALSEQFDVFSVPIVELALSDPRIFLSRAALRPESEIGEMEEFLYHQHWRVRDRDFGFNNDEPGPEDPPIENLDTGIVTERRYGMSWVAGDGDSWDDVPTDT